MICFKFPPSLPLSLLSLLTSPPSHISDRRGVSMCSHLFLMRNIRPRGFAKTFKAALWLATWDSGWRSQKVTSGVTANNCFNVFVAPSRGCACIRLSQSSSRRRSSHLVIGPGDRQLYLSLWKLRQFGRRGLVWQNWQARFSEELSKHVVNYDMSFCQKAILWHNFDSSNEYHIRPEFPWDKP